jgi:hypothetical protein
MFGGLPVELITMLGSSLLGGVMSIWGQSIQAKEANNKMMMAMMTKEAEVIDKARRYDNPHFGPRSLQCSTQTSQSLLAGQSSSPVSCF